MWTRQNTRLQFRKKKKGGVHLPTIQKLHVQLPKSCAITAHTQYRKSREDYFPLSVVEKEPRLKKLSRPLTCFSTGWCNPFSLHPSPKVKRPHPDTKRQHQTVYSPTHSQKESSKDSPFFLNKTSRFLQAWPDYCASEKMAWGEYQCACVVGRVEYRKYNPLIVRHGIACIISGLVPDIRIWWPWGHDMALIYDGTSKKNSEQIERLNLLK